MRLVKRNRTAFLMVAIAANFCSLFAGCAATPRDPAPQDYVFFSHYPELRRVPAPPGTFLYANPRKPIRDQERFIVNPAQIGFQPEAGHWLSPAQSQQWADLLRSEIIAGLSEQHQIVESPSAGVLRVSLALADICRREPSRSTGELEYEPFLVILITDSNTGEALMLLRDLNRGSEFAAAAQSDETLARSILSEWARTLCTRLEEVRRANSLTPIPQT